MKITQNNISKRNLEKIEKSNLLTDLEKEMLRLYLKGLKESVVANKIGYSPRQTYRIKRNLITKLIKNGILEQDKKKYNIYVLIFPNDKLYVGKTQNTDLRWRKGEGYKKQPKVYNAILKYGWENIEKKILYKDLTNCEAKQKENETIVIYKSYIQKYGYNTTIVGD